MSETGTSPWTALWDLDPDTYSPHALHSSARTYPETNCYTDIVIEMLHARGDEPLAAVGMTAAIDFEGDQWTFFKPEPADLRALFGIDVHEMQPWRALPEQIAEQLAAGRSMIVELDSWFLPDTRATSYRREHVKTSVVMEAIDVPGRRLRYFHNAGLHELGAEDFRGIFRLDGATAPDVLPPYTELVRFDAGPRLEGDALRARAASITAAHLAARPVDNPFDRFARRMGADLPSLLDGDAGYYHDYAFATVRMCGAAFDLLAAHARWLLADAAEPAVEALDRIVAGSKALSFRLARRRPFDPGPTLEGMALAWDEAMGALDRTLR